MKIASFGYGSQVFVLAERTGRDSDETKIEIDFSKSSFPDISVSVENKILCIRASGSIEQEEILGAFKAVIKMLEQ